MRYTIEIPGKPVGKERPRMGRGGHMYTPPRTKKYEALVAQHAIDACVQLMTGVRLRVQWHIGRTKGEGRRPKAHADLDNVVKTVMDGLQGVAYKNDREVEQLNAFFCDVPYGEDRIIITLDGHAIRDD